MIYFKEQKAEKSQGAVYNFNYQWHFKLADAFPLREAIDTNRDKSGRLFYELAYEEDNWEEVSLPHTFNDRDLFKARISDAGSGQKRTFAFYRKWFKLSKEDADKKVIIEFEGVRQTCYCYVNGKMAGFYESGVAPFAFDISVYIKEGANIIAIATDNTASRDLDYFSAETPNAEGAEPGAFYSCLTREEDIPTENRGVRYFWNCNDFNPSIGGLSKNVRLHIKPKLYLTLPIYSNLRTKGTYVYGTEYNIGKKKAIINIEAEIQNETGLSVDVLVESKVYNAQGNMIGGIISEAQKVKPKNGLPEPAELTITPKDAYIKTDDGYLPLSEDEVAPTSTQTPGVTIIKAKNELGNLRFWSIEEPYLYTVVTSLICDGQVVDSIKTVTGFRKVSYDGNEGLKINDTQVWLTGYAQRASNEWAAIGVPTDWLRDYDAALIKESNANHLRFMHVAACPADIRSCDRYGIVCTQPAGDKEAEVFNRQWDQRVELMRDIIIYFRNNPSIIFWEAGNNSINKEHMREMRLLKEAIDPNGGRFMGCRTINTEDVVKEAEYVGTMLNRHAARFQSELMPITETEYLREESPRRVWDDFSPPDFDYDNSWLGQGGRKQVGADSYDLTSEEFALRAAAGYSEFFNNRIGGPGKNLYSGAAALCWTDSAQHGRQSFSENARMSGRVDAVRIKKQSFDVFRVMQSPSPAIKIIGHWNYPKDDGENYRSPIKKFNGNTWEKTNEYEYRDPKNKTIYVVGSYEIGAVELFVNGVRKGKCDKPENAFIFYFDNIDVTQSGQISAKGYDYNGNIVCEDMIKTVGQANRIQLSVHTGEKGLFADGADVAFVDVEIVDKDGNICPLCYDRIDFSIEGNGIFLGGYNSGRFDGHGHDDSVIHKMHVYAECGTNRVFIRSTKEAGSIILKARMDNLPVSEIVLQSNKINTAALSEEFSQYIAPRYENANFLNVYKFETIKKADEVKYIPEDKTYCKILLDGQEPDTKGVLSIYDHEAVYGPIIYILERIKDRMSDVFDYEYDENTATLTIKSNNNTIIAKKGQTHLCVNGEECLMSGEPYVKEDGTFIAEINAIAAYIPNSTSWYDDKVNVFRINLI
jgi:beta-galactosidase